MNVTTKDEALKQALDKAYLEGFNASGEGYNGEYPFSDNGAHPEQDSGWLVARKEAIYKIIHELAQPEQEPVAWREQVLDLIDECPGLTMEQDSWLSRRVKALNTTPQPAPAVQPLTDEQIYIATKNAKKVDHTYAGWVRDQRIEFGRAAIAEFCRINGIGAKEDV